ncbi:hypothetical protein V2J09_018169 [Rumex salicifolius]
MTPLRLESDRSGSHLNQMPKIKYSGSLVPMGSLARNQHSFSSSPLRQATSTGTISRRPRSSRELGTSSTLLLTKNHSLEADCLVKNAKWATLSYIAARAKTRNLSPDDTPPTRPLVPNWKPPPPGWTKLNCDGVAHGNPGLASGGGIVRDFTGTCILSFSSFFEACSALHRELLAIHTRLQILANRNYPRVIVESDCLTLDNATAMNRNRVGHLRHPSIGSRVRKWLCVGTTATQADTKRSLEVNPNHNLEEQDGCIIESNKYISSKNQQERITIIMVAEGGEVSEVTPYIRLPTKGEEIVHLMEAKPGAKTKSSTISVEIRSIRRLIDVITPMKITFMLKGDPP